MDLGNADALAKSRGQQSHGRGELSSSSTNTLNEHVLPKAYHNGRAARAANTTVRTLGSLRGCVVVNDNPCGTFSVANNNRVFAANHQHCYGKKANITASFNLETMTCNTCTFRGSIGFSKGRWTALMHWTRVQCALCCPISAFHH
jgi:hypothetical protein